MKVPWQQLSPQALRGVIEEFITGVFAAHVRGAYSYHFESDAQTDPTTSFTQQWDQTFITVGIDYFIPLEEGQSIVVSGDVGRDFLTVNTMFQATDAPVIDQEADDDAWIIILLAGYDFDAFELRGGVAAFDTGGTNDEAQYAALATFGYRVYDFF